MTRSQCISPPPCSALCCTCISTPHPTIHPPNSCKDLWQVSCHSSTPGHPGLTLPLLSTLRMLQTVGVIKSQLSPAPRTSQFCPICPHTPSITFRHLPPNSARFSYATEGALFISTQPSTDAVSALRKVWVLIRLWKQPIAQART